MINVELEPTTEGFQSLHPNHPAILSPQRTDNVPQTEV